MKKLVFIFAVLVVACFTSCGDNTNSTNTTDTTVVDTVDTVSVDSVINDTIF